MLQKIYVEFYEQNFEGNEQELNDNINDTELESELPHSTIAENYSSKRQMKTENNEYACNHCEYETGRQDSLKRHIQSQH